MFEIDKKAFGEFLAAQRKAKGYTQKELAEKLFVSDKAVSKWERALSLPDVSLLIPLADILNVSVTELLEGRLLPPAPQMDSAQVEAIVKKAVSFSDETPEKKKERQKRNAAVFIGCTLFAALELFILLLYSGETSIRLSSTSLPALEGISFVFGVYIWFFMKERLPVYYDEHKINFYSDRVFHMNLPGIRFHNGNWPRIVKVLRLWSAISLVTVPAVYLLLGILFPAACLSRRIQTILLFLYLAALFFPVYFAGKKYE